MSQAITLARPYARAAFELARAAGDIGAWSQALAFAAAVSADARVSDLSGDPRVQVAQLVALHLPRDMAVDAPFGRFLAELAEHRRLALLPEIAGLYEQLRAEAERVLKATVTSASELPAAELDAIKASLKRRFGRDVEVETAVDASLIGGAVIDAGDVVIDGSLKGKLERLQAALAN